MKMLLRKHSCDFSVWVSRNILHALLRLDIPAVMWWMERAKATVWFEPFI